MIPTKWELFFSPQGQLKTWLGFSSRPSCHACNKSPLAEGSTVKNNTGERNGHSSYPVMANSKHTEVLYELFVQALPNDILESYWGPLSLETTKVRISTAPA